MSTEEYLFEENGREFLDNDKAFASSEFGSICWYIKLKEIPKPTKHTINQSERFYLESELRISDCYKTAALNFASYTKEEVCSRLEKINTLIKVLQTFQTSLKCAADLSKTIEFSNISNVINDLETASDSVT